MTSPYPGGAAGNSTAPGLERTDSNGRVPRTETALKRHRVLRALLAGPLTTFQAEKAPVFDHCLPSSISELRNKDRVGIVSTRITVPGYGGHPAHIARYELTEAGRVTAEKMLGAGR